MKFLLDFIKFSKEFHYLGGTLSIKEPSNMIKCTNCGWKCHNYCNSTNVLGKTNALLKSFYHLWHQVFAEIPRPIIAIVNFCNWGCKVLNTGHKKYYLVVWAHFGMMRKMIKECRFLFTRTTKEVSSTKNGWRRVLSITKCLDYL